MSVPPWRTDYKQEVSNWLETIQHSRPNLIQQRGKLCAALLSLKSDDSVAAGEVPTVKLDSSHGSSGDRDSSVLIISSSDDHASGSDKISDLASGSDKTLDPQSSDDKSPDLVILNDKTPSSGSGENSPPEDQDTQDPAAPPPNRGDLQQPPPASGTHSRPGIQLPPSQSRVNLNKAMTPVIAQSLVNLPPHSPSDQPLRLAVLVTISSISSADHLDILMAMVPLFAASFSTVNFGEVTISTDDKSDQEPAPSPSPDFLYRPLITRWQRCLPYRIPC